MTPQRKQRPTGDCTDAYRFPADQRPELCTSANVLLAPGRPYPETLFPRNCVALLADRSGVQAVRGCDDGGGWAWPLALQRLHASCRAVLSKQLRAHEGSAWLCGLATVDQFGETIARFGDKTLSELIGEELNEHVPVGRAVCATLPWHRESAGALYRITYARVHDEGHAMPRGNCYTNYTQPKDLDAHDGPLAGLPENTFCFVLFRSIVVVLQPVPPVPVYRLSRVRTGTEEPEHWIDALDVELGALAYNARLDIAGEERVVVQATPTGISVPDLAVLLSEDNARAKHGDSAATFAAPGASGDATTTLLLVTVSLASTHCGCCAKRRRVEPSG